MPVFIGDVLESCGGPILDLSGNKVKGFGVFDSVNSRDDLDTEFRTSGYLSVVGGDLEVYSGNSWNETAGWTKIASDFSLFDSASDEATSVERATQFVNQVDSEGDRYSFGVFDGDTDSFNKISGEDLKNIIINYFGQAFAQQLVSDGFAGADYFTDSTSGQFGDLTGDGNVTASDILVLLSVFGTVTDFSTVEKDYSIELGKEYWPIQGEGLDLVSNPTSFGDNTYSSTSNISAWENNYNVSGSQGGDDISFFVAGGNARVAFENIDLDNVTSNNLVSFFVGAGGSTGTITISADSDDWIRYESDFNFSGDIRAKLKVKIKDDQGDYLTNSTGGEVYSKDIGLIPTSIVTSGIFQKQEVITESENLVPLIKDFFGLAANSNVYKVEFFLRFAVLTDDGISHVSKYTVNDLSINVAFNA